MRLHSFLEPHRRCTDYAQGATDSRLHKDLTPGGEVGITSYGVGVPHENCHLCRGSYSALLMCSLR